MGETQVEHSQNVIADSAVNAQGDVIVGGQKITNIFYSAQYQHLKKRWDNLQARSATTRQKIQKYPDDEDFKAELLAIGQESNEVQKQLDELKSEVIRLAETITKISINTERLALARQHFETGNYAAARAILDAEQMGNEQGALLRQKAQQRKGLVETEKLLVNNANEFLVLARLTAVNFDLPDRFESTDEYFKQSLNAAHTPENTFAYAYFLQQHNQFIAASPFYLEALDCYRRLAEANPQTYLPAVAMTAVNISIFYLQSVSDREKSLTYAKEALVSGMPFVEFIPAVQNCLRISLQVAEAWGLDKNAFWEEAVKDWKNEEAQ